MTTYYVATLARYVLVNAETESAARELGHAALHQHHTDLHKRLGNDVPIDIRTVHPATVDEIELHSWHRQMVAAERA